VTTPCFPPNRQPGPRPDTPSEADPLPPRQIGPTALIRQSTIDVALLERGVSSTSLQMRSVSHRPNPAACPQDRTATYEWAASETETQFTSIQDRDATLILLGPPLQTCTCACSPLPTQGGEMFCVTRCCGPPVEGNGQELTASCPQYAHRVRKRITSRCKSFAIVSSPGRAEEARQWSHICS
jgi:hypothetical protein